MSMAAVDAEQPVSSWCPSSEVSVEKNDLRGFRVVSLPPDDLDVERGEVTDGSVIRRALR